MLRVWRRSFILILLLAGSPAAAQDPAAIGEVVALRGDVIAVRGAGSTALTIGAAILRSDRIRTGADARVKIRFLDGTVVALGDNSDLAAAEYAVDDAGTRRSGVLSLIRGLFRATVTPGLPDSRFELETTTAIASVRGTDFMGQTSVENTGIFVIDGAVAVSSKAPAPIESVLLRAGEGTDVPAVAVPTGVRRWSQRRIDALLAATSVP